jgi:NMD protein affecting ribosome stability and mRNA decay
MLCCFCSKPIQPDNTIKQKLIRPKYNGNTTSWKSIRQEELVFCTKCEIKDNWINWISETNLAAQRKHLKYQLKK